MRKAMDVIGLPILSLSSGKQLGQIRDILCDEEWRVLGFLVKEENWFQEGSFVPWDKLHAVGEDCLTITDDHAISSLHTLPQDSTICFLSGPHKIKGKTVFTVSGEQMGKVEDVYFSANWEKLMGYELSNGWIADVLEGRRRLPAAPTVVIGKEHVIVPESNRV